jgi:hypothetical protein
MSHWIIIQHKEGQGRFYKYMHDMEFYVSPIRLYHWGMMQKRKAGISHAFLFVYDSISILNLEKYLAPAPSD